MNYKKILKFIVLTLTLLISIFTVSLVIFVNNTLNKLDRVELQKERNLYLTTNDIKTTDPSDSEIPKKKYANKYIKNIALFGVDGDNSSNSRSDCIMILTIDTIHNKIKLSSIMRDSYVNIPTKNKKDKINHAYSFGGPELAIKTLNENFNLDIIDFASVNFSSFPKIVDELGGINLDITKDELKYINFYIDDLNYINESSSPSITSPGKQKVNGTQALAYTRIKYTTGGDFERTNRQRIVISQIFENLKSIDFFDYPELLNTLLPLIKTNLGNSDILLLAKDISFLKDDGIIQNRFPQDEDSEGKLINGVYYYVFNENATNTKIHDFIYK